MDTRMRVAEFLVDLACVFLIAAVLMVGTANAQTLTSNGVSVTARQSGNTVPQTPSNNVMNVIVPITIGVAAIGAAAVAIPATGAIAIAGDAIATAGLAAIRSGAIQGVGLAVLISTIGGSTGVALDANGNIVAPAVSSHAGDVGFNGYQWTTGTANGQAYGDSPDALCTVWASSFGWTRTGLNPPSGGSNQWTCLARMPDGTATGHGINPTSSCVAGYVVINGKCGPDPNGAKQPASDSQIKSAISTTPASWPSIYSSMNCGPTLALTNGPSSDPCFGLYSDSRSGFGVSFSTGGSSWTNNGCAVNSTSCPSATVTTAPTTDTQTKVNADGSKTTVNKTTTTTTTVTGTNDRTNPVTGQTTTTTTTSTTVTNPDGSTTTTNETVTDQAPPAAGTNGNQQDKDKVPPTTATLSSPEIKLYTKKTKTFGDVLNAFANTIKGSAIGAGVQGFFTVNASGSCPQWVVPATDWTPSIALGPIFCSSSASLAYQIAGYAVLAAAAFAAFAIAFL